MKSGLIIWDWIGTLAKSRSNSTKFFDDALPIVELFDGAYIQAVISKASNPKEREIQIKKSPFAKYMAEVKGVEDKTLDVFTEIMQKYEVSPAQTWVIDDRTRRGITIGNQLKCKTVWLARPKGKYLNETPNAETGQPYKTITSLTELTGLLLL